MDIKLLGEENIEAYYKLKELLLRSFYDAYEIVAQAPELKDFYTEFYIAPILSIIQAGLSHDKPEIDVTLDFAKQPLDFRVYAIAHEIAHIKLKHNPNEPLTKAMEFEADTLALSWLRDYPRYQRFAESLK